MARRIRVLQDAKQFAFGEQLEYRAQDILADRRADSDVASPIVSGTLQEIALTLDHIGRTQTLHEVLRRNLVQHECYLLTEILQREPRGHQVYNDYRLPERDRLRDKLREIERERRHLAMVEEDQLRGLRDRLLHLMNRHAHLQPE